MNLLQIEKVAKALADKTRLKIYEQIASGSEVCCSKLVELRGVTPATVSHHLKVLSGRREGQFVFNQANPEVLDEFTKSVKALAKTPKQ